ncbi:MAG TPA: hypothetical protein VFU88_11470 [Ktedonobacterales bacterium]|nr:hypothetical protein [Ktedonobacterales bacterium]
MVPNWSGPSGARGPVVDAKLKAFETIEEEFKRCFRYVQDVHGERRFEAFPVAATAQYLHALWVCDQKDHLLSVPKTIRRYEGKLCLELLRTWQEGDSVPVVEFLNRKLDMLPLADLAREVQQAGAGGDPAVVRRLRHGRETLLNRAFNLYRALDAIFALEPDTLREHVRAACRDAGHTPDEIAAQLATIEASPDYTFVRHPALARQNMLVMNALGVAITDNVSDRPGDRTDRVAPPTMPAAPYAQVTILGAMTLCSMTWNNPRHSDLANPPETIDSPDVLGRDRTVLPSETVPQEHMGPPFAP